MYYLQAKKSKLIIKIIDPCYTSYTSSVIERLYKSFIAFVRKRLLLCKQRSASLSICAALETLIFYYRIFFMEYGCHVFWMYLVFQIKNLVFKWKTLDFSRTARYFRGCLCDNWKPSFSPLLIFDRRTFSRRVTTRWWRQAVKNQVSTSTNQNSRNWWCLIVRRTIC